MDTVDCDADLMARPKDPIITVREILQDSDNSVDDQTDEAAETSFRQSPRKRNYQEAERSLNLIISTRKPSIEKEQVSPAKRHRNEKGMGSIRLQQENNDENLQVTSAETEITASEKGKERAPDTPKFGKGFGQSRLAPLEVAPSSPPLSQRNRSEFLKGHEKMSIGEEFAPSNAPSSSSEASLRSDVLKNSELQEPEKMYEYISNVFDSLYPSVENWIEQQRSQLETVAERINHVLGLIQQGERLRQNALTAGMASEMVGQIDQITTALNCYGYPSENSIKLNSCQEALVAQLRVLFATTDESQCLTELQNYAITRSRLGQRYCDREWMFVTTSFQLNITAKKLKEELDMINARGATKIPLVLEMNLRERESVLRQAKKLRKKIETFYGFGDL